MLHASAPNNKIADHFETIFELAGIGILVADGKENIMDINPHALREFGYSRDELIGKNIKMLLPDADLTNQSPARNPFSNNQRISANLSWLGLAATRKDGSGYPVEVQYSSYYKDGDKYLLAFINFKEADKKNSSEIRECDNRPRTDIDGTGNKYEILSLLEKSKSELLQLNNFQRILLDNIGAIIVTVDKKGIILSFNPKAEKELGYRADELIGKYTPEIYHERSLLIERAKQLSVKLQKTVSPGMGLFRELADTALQDNYEWIFKRKDGTKFPGRVIVTSMRDGEGQIIGYAGVAINISESKKNEQELMKALEKEKELNELKSRFVSMASHEFRTPLSTVLSSAYLIEKYTKEEDQVKREKHLQRIISSVNTLTEILTEFLSMGKIEEGKIYLRPSEFNIKNLLIQIVDDFGVNLKKSQKIFYEHEGNQLVLLDASLMKYIVLNLVSNASKFSPVACPIYIKTVNRGREVILSVRDMGTGISTEDQKHLMERFFRGKNATNIQGTGLGLHIVRKYTELMNGILVCRSELGKGTEFILTFKNNTGKI